MPTARRAHRRSSIVTAFAVVGLFSMVMPANAQEPAASDPSGAGPAAGASVPDASARGTVTTADGLALTVNTDGSVGTVKDGTRTLPRTTTSSGGPIAGGFSLRVVGDQPNLLANASFESPTSSTSSNGNWRFPTGTSTLKPTIATTQHRSGTKSAQIAISGTTKRDSLVAYQDVPVVAGTSYIVGGYSKTLNLGPNSTETTAQIVTRDDAPAQILVNMLNSSGQTTRGVGYRVKSYTGTSDWSRQSMGLKANTGEVKMRVTLRVLQGYGTVWFDDLSIARTISSTTSALSTVTALQLNGSGPLDDTVTQMSDVSGQPLKLKATYEPIPIPDAGSPQGIRIVGEVEHQGGTPANRAFQLTYTLPVGAAGWKYGDTPRSARVIANGTTYTFDTSSVFPAARYPWATIFDSTSDISLGSPLSKPRGYALRYNANSGLQIVFDLGVSTATLATDIAARHATFEIQLFRAPATWGFRNAIEKYYQLNPQSFVRRTDPAREGIPFYSPPLDELDPGGPPDDSLDFFLGLNVVGLGYNAGAGSSWGKPYVQWDEQDGRDIYSAAYTHHWGYFQRQCASGPPTCTKRTYDQVVAQLHADATRTCTSGDLDCERARDEAAAAEIATARDQNQRLRYDLLAGDFRLHEYGDIALPGAGPNDKNWAQVVRTYQLNEALDEAASVGATLDAIYVDSSSGMRAVWGNQDDYDRAKWAVTSMPLTFSYDTGNVSYKSFFANYLETDRTATWAHDNGMIMVLDTNGKEQTPGGILATDLADWLLVENSLRDLEAPPASAGITVDSYAMLKRTLAYQRPITTVDPRLADGSLLDTPTPSSLTGDTTVVSRVNQSLFYGIWPGPERWDSGNSTSWWNNPDLKTIYAKYGKLLRNINTSGWEPVPNATASNTNLWIERYGKASDPDRPLYIALRNETGSTLSNVTVTVRLNKDGLTTGVPAGAAATEKVQRPGIAMSGLSFNTNRTVATFTITVPAATTALVKFTGLTAP